MARMGNPERALVYKASDHACNQAIVVALKSGELIATFNEERTLIHADNGYTSIIRSKDGGRSWDQDSVKVIIPPTETEGNWDPGISLLSDVKSILSIGDAEMRLISLVTATVVAGEPAQISVSIPPGYEVASVSGASLERS